ncbi:MAG: regulatory protein RecX [Agathobacter sp.]|nr:regulatory protein RecX [Agathobacter sp.]
MASAISVESIEPLEKGKVRIVFDNGTVVVLYRKEVAGLKLQEGLFLSKEQYDKILYEIIGKRAKKRAMYLLEQMDRSERKLREKLTQNQYPEECVDFAIDYVKKYHYLDDYRYACTYVRYHGEKLSKVQLLQKLLQKGITKDVAQKAIEEEAQADEIALIRQWIQKKGYSLDSADEKETRRMYAFLLRRGFKSSDICKELHNML